jgi:hypothetical protein
MSDAAIVAGHGAGQPRLGAILAGGATDPNSGLLLILLALAYWPAGTAGARAPDPSRAGQGEPS